MASTELDIALAHVDTAQVQLIEAIDAAADYSADNVHSLIVLATSMAMIHATMTTELIDALLDAIPPTDE